MKNKTEETKQIIKRLAVYFAVYELIGEVYDVRRQCHAFESIVIFVLCHLSFWCFSFFVLRWNVQLLCF